MKEISYGARIQLLQEVTGSSQSYIFPTLELLISIPSFSCKIFAE